MKKCPTCKMTVDADSECPFCYTTITYEKEVLLDNERYVLNKFLVRYLIKQSWFSILCLIVVVLRLIHIGSALNSLALIPIVYLFISLFASFFGRKATKFIQWKYSVGYSKVKINSIKFTTGILAVLSVFIL